MILLHPHFPPDKVDARRLIILGWLVGQQVSERRNGPLLPPSNGSIKALLEDKDNDVANAVS